MKYKKIYLNKYYPLENNPTLEIYCPDFDDKEKQPYRKGILIIPGGGYWAVSKREGDPVACAFMERGYNAFVLRYTTKKEGVSLYPHPYLEVMSAIHYLRKHYKSINTYKNEITLLGFSAGGHLAGSYPLIEKDELLREKLGFKDEYLTPNSLVLCYPVLDLINCPHLGTKINITNNDESLINKLTVPQNVTKDYPKTFIWTTDNDDGVPSSNTYNMIEALKRNNVKHGYKIYPNGRHGLSLGNKALNPNVDIKKEQIESWPNLVDKFLRS